MRFGLELITVGLIEISLYLFYLALETYVFDPILLSIEGIIEVVESID